MFAVDIERHKVSFTDSLPTALRHMLSVTPTPI